jgi:hypothetical protein
MSRTGTISPQHGKSKTPKKRRSHSRSRRGCGNCRLRRVKVPIHVSPLSISKGYLTQKCDEKRPGCERCQKAHISCTYATGASQLQSSHEQPVIDMLIYIPHISSNQSVLGLINGTLQEYSSRSPELNHNFQLNLEDLSLLLRFKNRTVRSIGSQWDIGIWDKEFIRIVSLVRSFIHHPIL